MTLKHATHPDAEDAAPARLAIATDDEPGLSEDDYWAERRKLDAQRAQLEARHVASQHFPRWFYHAHEMPRVVGSQAAADALGAGWHVRPVGGPS
jgi:hypothetical protein